MNLKPQQLMWMRLPVKRPRHHSYSVIFSNFPINALLGRHRTAERALRPSIDSKSPIFSMLELSHHRRFFSLDFEYKTYTVEVPSPL
jgi:hypothetical protein